MGKKEEKDELEDVETISREQAQKEMQEAARKVEGKGSHQTTKGSQQDEEEEVTPETRAQAKEELREAVQRVREEGKKKPAGSKK